MAKLTPGMFLHLRMLLINESIFDLTSSSLLNALTCDDMNVKRTTNVIKVALDKYDLN